MNHIRRYLEARPYASFEIFFNNDIWVASLDDRVGVYEGETMDDAITSLELELMNQEQSKPEANLEPYDTREGLPLDFDDTEPTP